MCSCALLSSLASWAPAPFHMISVNSASSSSSFVSKTDFSRNVSGTLGRAYSTFTSSSTGSPVAFSPCWLQPLSIFLSSLFSPLSSLFTCQEEEKSILVYENWQNYYTLFCRFFSLARVYQDITPGTSLVVQWLRIRLPMQGMRVRSLVRELRSHMPRGNEACVPQLVSLCASTRARMPQTTEPMRHKLQSP